MLKYKLLDLMYILVYLHVSNVSAKKVSDNKLDLKDEMEAKIVGGVPIALKLVPYSVQIFNMGAMCAGTILNSWTILTAAHCFDMNKDIDEMFIQIGARYLNDPNADQYLVADVVVHKNYNHTGLFACDIALMFLEAPIRFSYQTKKTILVTDQKWMSAKERNFTVTGWGWTQYGGPVSDKSLMMTHLRFIPLEECSRLHNLQMSSDMFCLYGDGSRDTCKGDSGGGVFWKGTIVGITSHGDGCAKKRKPSVYTNVYYFRDWIRTQTLFYVNTYCRNRRG